MADASTIVGAIATAGTAVASAVLSVYKTLDVDGKLVEINKRLDALTASLAETRTFVQTQIGELSKRLDRRASSTGQHHTVGLGDTVASLACRVGEVEEWVRAKDEEAEAAEKHADREKMTLLLDALQKLTAPGAGTKRQNNG